MISMFLYGKKDDTWHEVHGEVVDVAPHLKGTFAVHIDPWRFDIWKVSEVETGCCVTTYCDTAAEAIEQATMRLALVDQAKLDAGIAKAKEIQKPRTEANTVRPERPNQEPSK